MTAEHGLATAGGDIDVLAVPDQVAAPRGPTRRAAAAWGGIAAMVAGVLIADLSTKAWAARQAQESGTSELVGPVRVKLSHNAGASFGLGAQRPVLTLLVSLAVTAGCLGWLTMARCAAERLAVGAVVGGALGNLADRVAHGAVTDWLHVTGYPPTFNLADLAVRLGALTAVVLRSRARRR